jgi:hypothetical protein
MRRSPLNPSRSLSKLVPERAGGIAGGIAGGYGAFIPHLLRIRGGIFGFLGHDPGSIAMVKWLGKIFGKKLLKQNSFIYYDTLPTFIRALSLLSD